MKKAAVAGANIQTSFLLGRVSLVCLISCLLLATDFVRADVYINEIANQGASGICEGNDWVELYNGNTTEVDLSKYILYDDKGADDEEAFAFPDGTIMPGESYLVLCNELDMDNMSPQFGISEDDTVTLAINLTESDDSNNIIGIVSTVPLALMEYGPNVTYAYDRFSGSYNYTMTPTPEAQNIIEEPVVSMPSGTSTPSPTPAADDANEGPSTADPDSSSVKLSFLASVFIGMAIGLFW